MAHHKVNSQTHQSGELLLFHLIPISPNLNHFPDLKVELKVKSGEILEKILSVFLNESFPFMNSAMDLGA